MCRVKISFYSPFLVLFPFLISIVFIVSVLTLGPANQAYAESNTPDTEPKHISVILEPGEVYTGTITVQVGDNPINKGDVVFVFDRTSSMRNELSIAKDSAVLIMDEVKASLPNTWFGVASFMDYPDRYEYPGYSAVYGAASAGDVPWERNLDLTDNSPEVAHVINGLWLGHGYDAPESYSRVLYELPTFNWRDNAKHIAVIYGDAPAHDLDFAGYNYGGDPGPDGLAQTDDDLDFEAEVQRLADAGITVIAVNSGSGRATEATFKGMSVGFAGTAGTKGQYAPLSQAEQLPDITAQLILSETQHIDQLSLQVTDAYTEWVSISPEMYSDVPPNSSRSFTVSLRPPESTTPGLYPFFIQAIGDNTIVDVTTIEIEVPGAESSADLGFRPSRDGFSFGNTRGVSANWEMFRQFFGRDRVEYPNGDRVQAADVFFREQYSTAGNEGACDGFTSTSIINYENMGQPNAGEFALPHQEVLTSANRSGDVAEAITFAQSIQTGLELRAQSVSVCDQANNSPRFMYHLIRRYIQNGSPVTIWFSWDESHWTPYDRLEPGAHSLTPYRYEEPSDETAFVYVYDPNRPEDDERRIVFDLANDRWTYRWHVPFYPDITLDGDASACQLQVVPADVYRHQGIPLWNVSGWKTRTENDGMSAPQAQILATNGPATLLIIDDMGRRLGFADELFFDEIPAASYVPLQHTNGSEITGSYYVPSDLAYSLTLNGRDTGLGGVSIYSHGYLVQLSEINLTAGTEIHLEAAANGSFLAVSSPTEEISGTLRINQLLTGEDRGVSLGNVSLSPNESAQLDFYVSGTAGVPDTIRFSHNHSAEQTVTFSLQRSGGDAHTVLTTEDVQLPANSQAVLSLAGWGNMSGLALSVDRDGDGIGDETRPLVNQSAPAAIELAAWPDHLMAGGEESLIRIDVRDQAGAFVANDTKVTVHTTLGVLSANELITSGGLVEVTLMSGADSGIATITVTAGDMQKSIDIPVGPFRVFLPIIVQ